VQYCGCVAAVRYGLRALVYYYKSHLVYREHCKLCVFGLNVNMRKIMVAATLRHKTHLSEVVLESLETFVNGI
jgi:hypothetical protein